MFGLNARRTRRDTTYFTNVYLGIAYQFWLDRPAPKHLAERLVAKSWRGGDTKLVGGGSLKLGVMAHTAEALQAGYMWAGVDAEERAMSAHALFNLLSYGVDPANSREVEQTDRQFLATLAQHVVTDPKFEAARSFSTPETETAYARLQARAG